MSSSQGRSRSRAPRSSPHSLSSSSLSPPSLSSSSLSDLDRRLLSSLSSHRVLTQTQLERLFDHVPARTLRYRSRRLHELKLLGRTRPYRDSGSAPFHLWPTRRADALVRAEPAPRGGDRHAPNPLFLAHAAALSELYVVLRTEARAHGLELAEFLREGEAREPFEARGKERSLAPDAFVVLHDERGRDLYAFVELDRGTMSHRRLRAKAALYAAYDRAGAWQERHPFCPALVFLTTTDARAESFLSSLAHALDEERGYRDPELTAAAGACALEAGRALAERCLVDLSLTQRLTFDEALAAARLPHDRERARLDAERRAKAQARQRLLVDPEALRAHLHSQRERLLPYLEALESLPHHALLIAVDSRGPLVDLERSALAALARALGDELLELWSRGDWRPSAELRCAAAALAEHYRAVQARRIEELAADHGPGPTLRLAAARLARGDLLHASELAVLPTDAVRDQRSRHEQQRARAAYLERREQGLVRRLASSREELYPRIDRQWLKVCPRCHELVYPPGHERRLGPSGEEPERRCHYCRGSDLADFDPERLAEVNHPTETSA